MPSKKQKILLGQIIINSLFIAFFYYGAYAVTNILQEYWSVFLIEEEEVSGAVAIYGNKVARQGSDFPVLHLVIIDLLDGSTRHYGQDEYVGGIDWIDMDGDWVVTSHDLIPQNTVNAINLVTDEHVEVFPYPGHYTQNLYPAIDGENIVWMHYRSCCGWDLLHFDLDSRTTISITNDGTLNTEYWPDVSGDWVVWNNGSSQNGDIYAYNMATTELVTVTQDADPQWYPKIDGNLLTWTDGPSGGRDIYGFDLETRQEFPLVTGSNSQYGQAIDGNLLTQRTSARCRSLYQGRIRRKFIHCRRRLSRRLTRTGCRDRFQHGFLRHDREKENLPSKRRKGIYYLAR
jgi:beta propeller repeat protein